MECYLCGMRMGPDDDDAHPACETEYDRRFEAGDCLRCGSASTIPPDIWCGECNSDSPYCGYPGPGCREDGGAHARGSPITECGFCRGPLKPGESIHHRVCKVEWERREDAGLCCRCGVSECTPTSRWCAGCIEIGFPGPYLGYPPKA